MERNQRLDTSLIVCTACINQSLDGPARGYRSIGVLIVVVVAVVAVEVVAINDGSNNKVAILHCCAHLCGQPEEDLFRVSK
jgi:hypothetical protein